VKKITKGQEVIFIRNSSADFNALTKELLESAAAGDIFIFDNFRVRCPGDMAGRGTNALVFYVK